MRSHLWIFYALLFHQVNYCYTYLLVPSIVQKGQQIIVAFSAGLLDSLLKWKFFPLFLFYFPLIPCLDFPCCIFPFPLDWLNIPFSSGHAVYYLVHLPPPPWVRKLSWSFAILQLVQLKYNLLQNLAPKFFWQLYFSPKYISPKYFSAVGAVKVQLVIDSIWHNNNNNSCSISPLRFADLGFVTKWIWSKTPNSHIYLPVSREYSQNSISAGENSSLTSM